MKRKYTDTNKEHKIALNNLLNSTKHTIRKLSNGDAFAGVYLISRPDNGTPVYVGDTDNMSQRMQNHINNTSGSNLNQMLKKHPSFPQDPLKYKVRYRRLANQKERTYFENYVIAVLQPLLNKQ